MDTHKRFTVVLPLQLHARMRIRCFESGVSMSEVVRELVERWLETSENAKPEATPAVSERKEVGVAVPVSSDDTLAELLESRQLAPAREFRSDPKPVRKK